MAKENTVFMYGIITERPTVKISSETKEFVVGRIKLLTVRRSYASEELRLKGAPRTDVQHVITRNPAIIEKRIVPLKEGDIVLVKGSICTRETQKKFRCPHCGVTNIYEGSVMVYIDPIFIEKTDETDINSTEAAEKLLSKAEISNYAFIFGTLCRDPHYYIEEGRKEECDFQIAVNRKRRIIEDGPEKTTDYPYVKTYGPKTKEYSEVLHTGSEIFINGAIQSREIDMVKTCGNTECGQQFEAKGATMEIIPYSIEYLKNCNIPTKDEEEEEFLDYDEFFDFSEEGESES